METLFKTSSVGMQQIGGVPVLCALTIALAISLFLFPLLHLLLFMSCNEKIPSPVLLTQTWSFTTFTFNPISFRSLFQHSLLADSTILDHLCVTNHVKGDTNEGAG